MKKVIKIFTICFISSLAIGQSKDFAIDSIKIYTLPWELHTVVAIKPDELRLQIYDEWFLKRRTITDSLALIFFQQINLNEEIAQSKYKEIDARMLIDVFNNGNIIKSISLNKVLFYNIGNRSYYRNAVLNNWIKKYVLKEGEYLPR